MPTLPSIGTKLGTGWGATLKRAVVDGEQAADVMAQQLRFRVVKAGATSVDDIRPDTALTRELWKDPATRRFAQGVLDLANEVSNDARTATPLRGFTLSTSETGYVLNRAVHHMRPSSTASMDAFEGAIDAARAHTSGTNALRKGAWLHMGPERSAGMVHMLRNPGTQLDDLSPELRRSLGRGVKTLLHELNHVSSPRPAHAKEWDWLSEGIAETLARWPGRVPAAGQKLGFEVPSGVGRGFDRRGGSYPDEVRAVRGLLRLAGINPKRSGAFPEAERLLNGPTEDLVAGALATRIAARHADTPAAQRRLATRIERRIGDISTDGSRVNPRVMEHLTRELGSR